MNRLACSVVQGIEPATLTRLPSNLQPFLLFAIAAGAFAACGDDPVAPPKTHGQLTVSVNLSGLLPSRTVQIIIDDTLSLNVTGPGDTHPNVAYAEAQVSAGLHRVTVLGLDPNCAPPVAQTIKVLAYGYNVVSFEVACEADPVVTGRGMAWVESYGDWGNSLQLVIRSADGSESYPESGASTIDLAWSPQGHELAILGASNRVRFLDPQDAHEVRSSIETMTGIALSWVPAREAVGILELWPDGCRIRIAEAPWTRASVQFVPCGGVGEGIDVRGDIAWSGDGLTAAVSIRRDASLRLVSAESGAVVMRALPDSRFAPIAVAWMPGGPELLVLGMCVQDCAPDRLVLLRHDPAAGTWVELGAWDTEADDGDRATLDVLDADHVLVGPVKGWVRVLHLGAPGESRPLGRAAWRMSRRPG